MAAEVSMMLGHWMMIGIPPSDPRNGPQCGSMECHALMGVICTCLYIILYIRGLAVFSRIE